MLQKDLSIEVGKYFSKLDFKNLKKEQFNEEYYASIKPYYRKFLDSIEFKTFLNSGEGIFLKTYPKLLSKKLKNLILKEDYLLSLGSEWGGMGLVLTFLYSNTNFLIDTAIGLGGLSFSVESYKFLKKINKINQFTKTFNYYQDITYYKYKYYDKNKKEDLLDLIRDATEDSYKYLLYKISK